MYGTAFAHVDRKGKEPLQRILIILCRPIKRLKQTLNFLVTEASDAWLRFYFLIVVDPDIWLK